MWDTLTETSTNIKALHLNNHLCKVNLISVIFFGSKTWGKVQEGQCLIFLMLSSGKATHQHIRVIVPCLKFLFRRTCCRVLCGLDIKLSQESSLSFEFEPSKPRNSHYIYKHTFFFWVLIWKVKLIPLGLIIYVSAPQSCPIMPCITNYNIHSIPLV